MTTIYPVRFDGDNSHIVFVAFDRAAANQFANEANDEAECEILSVEEIALIDNYGFHCSRGETKIVAPWLANVTIENMRHYSPAYQARRDREYIREMSMGG